ncbi:MAG: (4Fe-4S)-binding protein [Ruminococcus callidus]
MIAATTDENGLPVTCAIDMMDWDENGLYFLTAKGKNFYHRLKQQKYIALTGVKGKDTMSSIALSIGGKVTEIGAERLPLLFQKNPYMHEISPTAESAAALTVFQIYAGKGEWFDLSKKPIERDSFTFGEIKAVQNGYVIGAECCGCGACLTVCPQDCIDLAKGSAVIRQNNCLHCGNCLENVLWERL